MEISIKKQEIRSETLLGAFGTYVTKALSEVDIRTCYFVLNESNKKCILCSQPTIMLQFGFTVQLTFGYKNRIHAAILDYLLYLDPGYILDYLLYLDQLSSIKLVEKYQTTMINLNMNSRIGGKLQKKT